MSADGGRILHSRTNVSAVSNDGFGRHCSESDIVSLKALFCTHRDLPAEGQDFAEVRKNLRYDL